MRLPGRALEVGEAAVVREPIQEAFDVRQVGSVAARGGASIRVEVRVVADDPALDRLDPGVADQVVGELTDGRAGAVRGPVERRRSEGRITAAPEPEDPVEATAAVDRAGPA